MAKFYIKIQLCFFLLSQPSGVCLVNEHRITKIIDENKKLNESNVK